MQKIFIVCVVSVIFLPPEWISWCVSLTNTYLSFFYSKWPAISPDWFLVWTHLKAQPCIDNWSILFIVFEFKCEAAFERFSKIWVAGWSRFFFWLLSFLFVEVFVAVWISFVRMFDQCNPVCWRRCVFRRIFFFIVHVLAWFCTPLRHTSLLSSHCTPVLLSPDSANLYF